MKKFILLTLISIYFFLNASPALAITLPPNDPCDPKDTTDVCDTAAGYECLPASTVTTPPTYKCRKPTATDIVGKVTPPTAIQNLGVGGEGISNFLSGVVTLIYILASVVFVFMILWAAFQWLTAGGDKEQLDNAKKRITQAVSGIIIFAAAYAILQVLDIFTGFTFFVPKGIAGCDDIFYYDTSTNECIHKYATSKPCGASKSLDPTGYNFKRVDNRFCGK